VTHATEAASRKRPQGLENGRTGDSIEKIRESPVGALECIASEGGPRAAT
jgi:hypothetical protein